MKIENKSNPEFINEEFCPERLKIAREYAGFSQSALAKTMQSCTQAAISRFEDGDLIPSSAQVETIANTLGWNTDFFFLPATIVALPATTHFRKKATVSASITGKVHAQVNLTIATLRLLQYKPAATYDLQPIIDAKLPPLQAADKISKLWQLSPTHPFNLSRKIEESGILVVEMPLGGVDAGEIDGLSIVTSDLGPIIFINAALTADRMRFTLAHELGHVLMHHLEPRASMEDEANDFAGNLILPKEMLKAAIQELPPLTFSTLPLFKRRLMVSMAMIVFRLRQYGYLPSAGYTAAWREFNRLGWKKTEPYPIEREVVSRFRSLLTDVPSVCKQTGLSPQKLEELYLAVG